MSHTVDAPRSVESERVAEERADVEGDKGRFAPQINGNRRRKQETEHKHQGHVVAEIVLS